MPPVKGYFPLIFYYFGQDSDGFRDSLRLFFVDQINFPGKLLVMATDQLQQTLFQHIRSILPSNLSLVDEIAEVLSVSNDSAYRRIRGETVISLEEVQKIATHFKISVDQFLHLKSDSFLFSGNLIDSNTFLFETWMQSILQQMQFINGFQHKHVYFLTKDLPFYEHFQIPELAAFKHFFWKKSILHYEEMRGMKFTLNNLDPAYHEMGKKIVETYNQIPSTEIWNLECINSTIRQIEFYREAKIIEDAEIVQCLYDKVGELINHFEVQAELGLKFSIKGTPKPGAGTYTLFVNEIMLGDNTFHAVLDGKRVTFLNHSTINYIVTRDDGFTAYMQDVLDNLIRKSIQISISGEKERSRFFDRLRDKIKLSARL